MRWLVEDHKGKDLTGRRMYAMAKTFWPDLGNHLRKTLPEFYDMVRRIPYQNDADIFNSSDVELLGRPAYLLDRGILPKLDCKKKAILLGAYFEGAGLPWKLVAVSERPSRVIHHVLPLVKLGRVWATADATLPQYYLGQPKKITAGEVLTR